MTQAAPEYAEVNNLSNNSKCLAVIHQLLNTGIKTVLKMTNCWLYQLLHFVAGIHDMLNKIRCHTLTKRAHLTIKMHCKYCRRTY